MGVESYAVGFKPVGERGNAVSTGGERTAPPLTVKEVEETLLSLGFIRLPLRTDYGPAQTAAPPVGETEYERRDADAVIQALVRWDTAEPGHPSRTDFLPVTGISVRFAMGQPAAAEEEFLAVVAALLYTHSLYLPDGRPQKAAAATGAAGPVEQFFDASLRVRLRSDIAALRANWRRLFPGNVPEKPLSPGEAWTYYLQNQSAGSERREEEDEEQS